MKVWCVDCKDWIDTLSHHINHEWDFKKKLTNGPK